MKGQSYYITHFLLDFALYFISPHRAFSSPLSLLLYDSIGCEKYFFNLKISISFREYLYGKWVECQYDDKKRRGKKKKRGGEIVAVAASSTVCFNSIRFDIRVVSCHCVARR